MAKSWVVKLRLADSKDAVLINVTAKDSNKPLDLDLLATDGDFAYGGKLRARSLDKLRAKNYNGTSDEWTSILTHILVSKEASGLDPAVGETLEVRCSIKGKDPKATLSVSFRTLVQDITQQLGSIELPQTDDEGVDLFGWAGQLADQRDELREKATSEQKHAGLEAKNVEAVQKQLDELTLAKLEHEQELMAKFTTLLNEKKLELRKMKRVLASAQPDAKHRDLLKGLQESGTKRGKKRATADDDETDDESEAFETDVGKADEQAEENEEPADDQETASEDAESENEVNSDHEMTSQTQAGPSGSTRSQNNANEPLPSRRDLPFTKKQPSTTTQDKNEQATATVADDDDEATESEDDEL